MSDAAAFLSYAHRDDAYLDGGLTALCQKLALVVSARIGHDFAIFQDRTDIRWGQHWPSRLAEGLAGSRFLIPVLSPSFFTSDACQQELTQFLELERATGRRDLILPLYLLPTPLVDDRAQRAAHRLAAQLAERQYRDWRPLLHLPLASPDVRQMLDALAGDIVAALGRSRTDAASPPFVPDQGAGVHFEINQAGLIDVAPDGRHDDEQTEARLQALQDHLLEACDRLLGSFSDGFGQNAFGYLINDVRQYREAISGPLADIQFTSVWVLGLRLQNLADALARDVERLGPSLEDDQQAALADLVGLQGPFALSSPEGRTLQALADRHQTSQAQREQFRQAAAEFEAAVQNSTDLVTDRVKELVELVNREVGTGRFPERELVAAVTTDRNLLSVLARTSTFVAGAAAGGVIESAVTGSTIGQQLAHLGTAGIDALGQAASQFLCQHAPILKGLAAAGADGLAWLEPFVRWLKRKQPSNAPQDQPPALAPPDPRPRTWTPGTIFRDVDALWCPEMVVIPAGSFTMGAQEGEADSDDHGWPQHPVRVPAPFALGRFPVTFDEFDEFCVDTSRTKPEDQGWGRGRRPVIQVSGEDADAYLAWLGGQTGEAYRLPSEAEWEYACRAGTATPFWTGATITTDQANYDGNFTYGSGQKGDYRQRTTPVDQFKANPFGLHDMHGNVWEWCADHWHDDYRGAPADGTAWLEGGGAWSAVLRGGSWIKFPWNCRSAYRVFKNRVSRSNDAGFRAARTLG